MKVFRPGEVWRYHTRPGEEASRLTVLLVEPGPRGDLTVHIEVGGLQIHNPKTGNSIDTIRHLPISVAALSASATERESEGAAVPDFREGYQEWTRAGGGVFAVALAEAVGLVEQTIAQ